MTSPLTKSELCWIIVRLAGVSFIYGGVSVLFGAALTWQSFKQDFELASTSRKVSMLKPIKTAVASSLLPLGIGVYLLKYGELLHRCLMFVPGLQPTDRKNRELAPGIVLANDEIEAFHTWLEQHPEFKNRPLVDQIALFRDAQGSGPGR